ncbi:MAG TPA: DUF456 domain-containing protein [Gemmatimonadales bacterium]|nr:DUF456 domain-containing protein [Gemmatimonadales bacterium]
MTELLGIVLLVLGGLAGLLMVPLGLPGLWIMVLGVLAYGWLTAFQSVGVWTIGIVLGLAFLGEIIEAWIGFRFARRYGGSRRAAWGALAGGLVGAVMGVPLPVLGSVVGAFVGSFVGAVVFEFLGSRQAQAALNAGKGAVLGRAVAAAAKVGIGVVIAVVGVMAVLRA